MRGRPNPKLKSECIRLRVDERKSLREIHHQTGAAKGSLSRWLTPYPLTKTELQSRRKKQQEARKLGRPKKDTGSESQIHKRWPCSQWTRLHKAKVSEAAVLLRLVAAGFSPFGSVFDGDKTDWLVETPAGIRKIQIKWARRVKQGLPFISLQYDQGTSGQRRYLKGEVDFFVGYDYFTDTCYIWSWDEVSHLKAAVTINPAVAEQWGKLLT